MTEMNKDDAKENATKDARTKRRSILKAGAVIAPLALTLHGGIPMAHASSTGCVDDLITHVKIPIFESDNGGFVWTGDTEPFSPSPASRTGRGDETHWDYLVNEELFGASCLTSIQNSGLTVNF